MTKKKQRESWKEFLIGFMPKIAHLRDYDSWKEDFVATYGYVWTRWYQNLPAQNIIKDLTAHIMDKESRNRHGTISVKVNEEKIRLSFKSEMKQKAWQKIIMSRFWDRDNIIITKGLNISLDFILTEEEKRLIENENIDAKRIFTPGQESKPDNALVGNDSRAIGGICTKKIWQ
jgi:hypothetical protein